MAEMKLIDFVNDVYALTIEIVITLHYANEILAMDSVPIEAKKHIRDNALRFKNLLNGYDHYLNMNFDEKFEQKTKEMTKSFEKEMLSVYKFLDVLDQTLMKYGDGPPFSKKHYMHTQPIEV